MLQLRNNAFYRIVGFVLATVVLLAPTVAQGAPDTNITGTVVTQAESFQQTDTDANIQGTQCANYDMGIGYWHPVRVLWFTMNVPVSDEIRIRYCACWNDSLVWQDSGPIQIVNSAGSTFISLVLRPAAHVLVMAQIRRSMTRGLPYFSNHVSMPVIMASASIHRSQ